MRLAFHISHFDPAGGGAEGFACGLCRELARRGHELHVCCADGRELPGVSLHLCPGPDAVLARVRGLAPDKFIDWGLAVPADIHRLGGGTHAEFTRYNLLGRSPAGRLFRQFACLFSRGHRASIRREQALLNRPGATFLAVSEFVRQQVLRTAPVPPERVKVLMNGVNTERFSPAAVGGLRATARRELELADGQPAFLFVGHNLRLKNLDLLLRVFSRLQTSAPEFRLVVLGKRRPPIARPWLSYVGAAPDPERFYAAADALLHPTYYDACANVVLEAMACGLPVVSSNHNGSAENITNGSDGFVLPVTGPASEIETAWSEAALSLGRDPGLRQRVGAAAAARAGRMSLAAYTDAFEQILEQTPRHASQSKE